MGDYGDLDDLRARISSVESELGDRLVPVIGSGLSNSVIPNVADMTKKFGQAMPRGSEKRFAETIAPIMGTTLGYQNAASLLKLRAGDGAIARVIRRAVLESALSLAPEDAEKFSLNPTQCEDFVTGSHNWQVPPGYRGLADLYHKLDGSQRGPILTTNFDPLIEVAFRQAGIDAAPVPVPFDVAPAIEQLSVQSAVPILHIHGYWTSNATLNTASQLTRPRPNLEGLLREIIRSSTVLVTGYGGWDDAFMTSLASRVKESTLLNANVLWAAFNEDPNQVLENETLRALDGSPGFALYIGVDGNLLFQDGCEEAPPGPIAPFGYTGLPLNNPPTTYEPEAFVEGREPSWADAESGRWPILTPTNTLIDAAQSAIGTNGGKCIVAVGPMGEGKTLALRQAAVQISDANPEWQVLWREPGAPRISKEWIVDQQKTHPKLVVCADEGDLIVHDIHSAKDVWSAERSGIVFVLASHDRLWQNTGRRLLRGLTIEIPFQGLESVDAHAIAEAWAQNGLLPSTSPGQPDPVKAVADQLEQSSHSLVDGQHATLFGAVLDVRHGRDLSRRVADLMNRLDQVRVRNDELPTLGDVFGGICLLQDSCDRYGALGRGATRSFIAAMVGLNGVFADGKILQLLGKEAAITYSGDRVYSRHPAIARTVVEELRESGRLVGTARLVAMAGARLRDQGGIPDSDYRSAYLISKELREPTEALEAAKGAVLGAPQLLEPRVTLLSHWRKVDLNASFEYAKKLAPTIDSFRDYGAAARAYLNEYAQIAGGLGETQFGIGLCGLALSDGTGFVIDKKRAQYLLVSIAKLAKQMIEQNQKLGQSILDPSIILLDRIGGVETREQFVGKYTVDGSVESTSSTTLCDSLRRAIAPLVESALPETGLPTTIRPKPTYNELARLG